MKKNTKITLLMLVYLLVTGVCNADCPLDHFLIGCNPDGITGTEDDNKLFVDCTQKYRHSDPDHSGDPTWLNWFYPLYYNPRYDRYQIGEPGFDVIEDPNWQLAGVPDVDYRIIVKCISVTPGFSARNTTLGIILDEPNDWFNHSELADPHIHLEFRAPAPDGTTELQWITCIIYDQFGIYEQSDPFSVVFVKEPLAGDLAIDGVVDVNDLFEFCYYWPQDDGGKSNDYYERADVNRDGLVNFGDFALLALNWQPAVE